MEKSYLMCIKSPPEMGSEGWANYFWYGVGIGNTIEEAVEDYRVKITQDAKKQFSKDDPDYEPDFSFDKKGDRWTESYGYELCIVPLRSSDFDHCKNIEINYI